jgi:hypothetical protein
MAWSSAFRSCHRRVLSRGQNDRTTQNRAHKCARASIARIHFALLRNIDIAHYLRAAAEFHDAPVRAQRARVLCRARVSPLFFFTEALLGRLP